MNTWFNTPDRISLLEAHAAEWIGTPFRNNSAVQGIAGGVSCHNLVAELYFACGTLPRFAVPRGTAKQLQVSEITSLMLGYLDEHLGDRFATLDVSTAAIPGDLIVIEDARTVQHLGVLLRQNLFIHVLKVQGVMRSLAIDPTFGRRLVQLRRPLL